MENGLWTDERHNMTFLPPTPPVPFEGARVQRERITRTDMEAFSTIAGCTGLQCDHIWKASTSSLQLLPCQGGGMSQNNHPRKFSAFGPKLRDTSEEERKFGRAAGELPTQQKLKDCRSHLTQTQERDVSSRQRQQLQWQLTDGRQPCTCRVADTAKFGDR